MIDAGQTTTAVLNAVEEIDVDVSAGPWRWSRSGSADDSILSSGIEHASGTFRDRPSRPARRSKRKAKSKVVPTRGTGAKA